MLRHTPADPFPPHTKTRRLHFAPHQFNHLLLSPPRLFLNLVKARPIMPRHTNESVHLFGVVWREFHSGKKVTSKTKSPHPRDANLGGRLSWPPTHRNRRNGYLRSHTAAFVAATRQRSRPPRQKNMVSCIPFASPRPSQERQFHR